MNYDEQLDDMDASVFTGEILFINLEEFKEHLARWQKAVDEHEGMRQNEKSEADKFMHELTHLTIDQMLELVKKSGKTAGRRYRATGPKASAEGEILDPYLGMIQMDGEEGFMLASEWRYANDVTWELI